MRVYIDSVTVKPPRIILKVTHTGELFELRLKKAEAKIMLARVDEARTHNFRSRRNT